ncbi:MAG: ATP-binding protein [Bacilli bacterium]|nr:ATP-binding protein [Bacilli bacterium]
MVIREHYLAKIRGFYESDLVKVITGVRRCGKSVILETIMNELRTKSSNIIYLNFEKSADLLKAGNASELISYVKKNKGEGKCYCFFDEIQEIEDWQIAVKDLRLDNCSIFITGSNSKLLSSEFLTLLSGRFVSFRIRPFVYKEIKEYCKEKDKEIDVTDYLIWGGFPGRLEANNVSDTKTYLTDLMATLVINDLIKRYKIKKQVEFKRIVNFILESNARIYSIRSIHKALKGDFDGLAATTVARYIDYLKQAYIIDEIPQFSTKTKKELHFYGKSYNCDVSLNSLLVEGNRFDLDHNMENVVYNELLYMGYELSVYNNNGKEIDFLAKKDGKSYYVQVAYSVMDNKAYEREMSAFDGLDQRNQKVLITTDPIDYSTSLVRHINLNDFLLMEEL